MDLFHRVQEPEERKLQWIKPFDSRMAEITRLSEKSETCPKEMKKVFLTAWGELAAQVKVHQKLASQIVSSGLPLKVYYNLVLDTDLGSGTADFLFLSDEYIVVVLLRKKEHIEWDRYDTRFSRAPGAVDAGNAEEAAGIVAEYLLDSRVLSRKELMRVVPVLIDDEESEMSGSSRPVGRSLLFPDIHETVRVHPDVFGHWLETNCGGVEKRGLTEVKQEKIIEALANMGR